MKKFDLVIIGGGAGGFAAAIKANELAAKILMVNHGLPVGGTCVNVGCVPSKTLLWAAEVMHQAKHHHIPGVDIEVKSFDFQTVVQDELNLVEKLRAEKYEKVLAHLQNATYLAGRAAFISANEIEVNGPASDNAPAAKQKFTAGKFIIAAGSTATVPLIAGLRETGFVTHIEALKLKIQPKELVIIGAGPVGLEFGQMYARFGTKVTILQRGGSIFRPAETELTARLQQLLAKEGITIKTNVEVQKAYRDGDKKVLVYKEADLSPVALAKGDEILLAGGKTPNTKDLGLEKAGVAVSEKQAVAVNQYFQTSNQNIFAVGDVTNAPLRLETTAGREGTLAAENALSGAKNSLDYNTVPYAIFTDPQLAGVGLTEAEQMKQMGVCACRTVSFKDIPKAIIMRQTEGLIKMVIHPQTSPSTKFRAGQILGVHILAPNAGELIAEAMMLIKNKNTIDDVVNSLPMFPTLSEAIKLVALSFTRDISKLSCCI